MFYSLLIIAAVVALLLAYKKWYSLEEKQRKDSAWKMVLWGVAVLVIALVLAGRAHWLMGVLAALLALAGRVVQLAQYVPLFKRMYDDVGASQRSNSQSTKTSSLMSKKEAAEILGVDEAASAEDVKLAHKRLMQKIHPDRGGTDALAQQINTAKDILLS